MGYPVLQQHVVPPTGQPHIDSMGMSTSHMVNGDNVFFTVVASIQYRALTEKAFDAYYKLSNTKSQIQAYVFDGAMNGK
ncbi:hypothetical protein AgCh_036810 [Apium graveolens]